MKYETKRSKVQTFGRVGTGHKEVFDIRLEAEFVSSILHLHDPRRSPFQLRDR